MILPGGIIGGALPSITRTATGAQTTAVNPHSFTGLSLGTAGRRHIGLTIGWVSSKTITSVTVGGVAATLVTSTSVLTVQSAIYIASVPTGTTGDVVVTFSAAGGGCLIAVYALYNLRSATAFDTATDAVDGGVGSYTLNLDANIAARGVVFSSIQGAGVAIGPTVSGLNNQVTVNANPLANCAADYTATAAETPRTMGWTANVDTAACLATFR
ncbi:MAG: hypothetical protein CTY28_10145 [Hyphomicrobium sp.]|nr:MAG: hypothetical protein CTY28_10145 [Hyphomicrobium sp.]